MAMRVRSASGFYHIMLRGNGKQLIFEDDVDRRRFLSDLQHTFEGRDCSVIVWCLMDNHVHLVVDDRDNCLSSVMQTLCMRYAQYFNMRHERVGHLFEGRFKSLPIESNEYLLQAVRYVLNNPVAAGMGSLEEYPWSSFAEYCDGIDGITDTEPVLAMFTSMDSFIAFCHEGCEPFNGAFECDNVPDELASVVALEVVRNVGCEDLSHIKTYSLERRGEVLCALKRARITDKQIVRLTGISRSSVYRCISAAGL